MALTERVWGIDIGQCALKALKLVSTQGEIRVEAFEIIEHPRILTQLEPGERDQAINAALEQFLTRNDVTGADVVVSIPGQSGFTRFVKLPPVEEKQVPEIVRFEAEQQIPFSIDEVIWRWQSFRDPDSPDIEVGIFAMKRSDVWGTLKRFEDTGVVVDVVQMAPLALYNFMDFDGQTADDGATLLVDIGADKTDLVVADGPRIWTRTIQLGGNNFTEVLVKAFKLTFSKAEKLKRTAGTSKYARQIFQAMRPVFAELVQEIQRSIGYYTSLHRESRFRRVLGLGNGFRLPGIQKYLEQNLGTSVVRVDGYEKLSPSPAANAPVFAENVLSFAAAYGLALQGLGVTRIRTNLLPVESARRRRWTHKRPFFAAAAATILVILSIIAWRAYADSRALEARGPGLTATRDVVQHYGDLRDEFRKNNGLDKAEEKNIHRYKQMMGYRNFMPTLICLVSDAVREVASDQGLMTFANVDELNKKPRSARRMIVVNSLDMKYMDDLSGVTKPEQIKAGYSGAVVTSGSGSPGRGPSRGPSRGPGGMGMEGGGGERGMGGRERFGRPSGIKGVKPKTISVVKKPTGQRGYLLYLAGSTPLPYSEAVQFLGKLRHKLGDLSGEFESVEITLSWFDATEGKPLAAPAGTAAAAGSTGLRGGERREQVGAMASDRKTDDLSLDPLTGEYAGADTRFVLGWKVVIKDDGLPKDDQAGSASKAGGAR